MNNSHSLNQYERRIQDFLLPNEKVLWVGKPNENSTFADTVILCFFAMVAVLVVCDLLILKGVFFRHLHSLITPIVIFGVPICKRIITRSRAVYAVTDKRVIIYTRVKDDDFDNHYYEDLSGAAVTKKHIFGTGDIELMYKPQGLAMLEKIQDADVVCSLIQNNIYKAHGEGRNSDIEYVDLNSYYEMEKRRAEENIRLEETYTHGEEKDTVHNSIETKHENTNNNHRSYFNDL